MNPKMVEEIKGRLREKTSEELAAIWTKNDRSEWSEEAFQAIRQLLTDRGVTVPTQNLPPDVQQKLDATEQLRQLPSLPFKKANRIESNFRVRTHMSTTLFFRESAHLSFPSACVGCGGNYHGKTLRWTIFSSPSLSSGAKAFKAANVILGLTMGGLDGGMGGALGGARGGAYLGNTLKKARATALHTLPVCQPCLSQFSSVHLQQLSEASEELFQEKGIKTPAFSLRMEKGCAIWSVENETFAQLVADMNRGRVFMSLDDCIAHSHSSLVQEEVVREECPALPVIAAASLAKYESIYKRKLSPIEGAIIDSWHSKVGKFSSIYTYPDIPEKKLRNATSSYGHLSPDSLIIALQDSTVFGSAKEGAIFASGGIHWKSINSTKVCRIAYRELVPSSVTFESSFTKKHLIFGPEQRIEMSGFADEKPLVALCAFVTAAAWLSRSREDHDNKNAGTA